MRALIDTGASVSLLREREYKYLRNSGWMRKADIGHPGKWGPYKNKGNGETPSENRRDGECPEVLYNPRLMHRGDLRGTLASAPWSKYRVQPHCLNSKWRKDAIGGGGHLRDLYQW